MKKVRKKKEREKKGEKRGKRREKKERKEDFFMELHVPEYKQARGARRAEGAARSEKFM